MVYVAKCAFPNALSARRDPVSDEGSRHYGNTFKNAAICAGWVELPLNDFQMSFKADAGTPIAGASNAVLGARRDR